MIISITNLKGGSGKTTISIHLAVSLKQRGFRTCILDTDHEQRSSMKWSSDRSEDAIHIPVYGMEIKQIVKEVNKIKQDHDVVIIDGAPKLQDHAENLMVVSDIVIIPMKPSILDFRSTEEFIKSFRKVKTLKEMQNMGLQGCVVITDADERTLSFRDIKEAVEGLEEGVFFTIPSLVAYKDAIQNGEGVTEYDKGRAATVFNTFADHVINLFTPERLTA